MFTEFIAYNKNKEFVGYLMLREVMEMNLKLQFLFLLFLNRNFQIGIEFI